MDNSLFKEFKPVSLKEWKQKIQADLKGADYNQTLVWKTNEGIQVNPVYHSDNFNSPIVPSNTETASFKICQSVYVSDAKKANLKALEGLSKGAESIQFIISKKNISLKDLLKNIDPTSTPIHFKLLFLDSEFCNQISSISAKANIVINIDIIGNLAKSGNWFKDLKEDYLILDEIIKNSDNFTSSLSIDASLYQNAGATIVQQLGYALAHANEYLNRYENKIKNLITFNVAIGTNYFFEIAKLRALRKLWHSLATEYKVDTNCYIYATPSKRNKTLYDYNTNMLRTTTECMSAILGGANTISNLAYDTIYHKENEFGERIARNQLLILKHESYLDKVNNPVDGAYYIEILTNQLAEKALELFKNIEANGGFLQQLKKSTIQRKIKESALKEQEQFNNLEQVLVGTNKYSNSNDKMKDELELYPFVKMNKRKTIIEPIIENRLAEILEQNRLKTE